MRTDLSTEAKFDLAHIIAFLEPESPAAARKLSDQLEAAILRLSDFPRMGRKRDDLTSGARSVIVSNYLIVYRVETDAIFVLRVLDGRMDLATEFRQ
jgi:toxin ParE1/3/4